MTEVELHSRRALARHPRIRRERIPTTVLDLDQPSSTGRHPSVRRCATRPWSHAAPVTLGPPPHLKARQLRFGAADLTPASACFHPERRPGSQSARAPSEACVRGSIRCLTLVWPRPGTWAAIT